jgi:hypothetical protein
MNAVIAGVFPIVAAHSKAAPFAFFALMMVLQFVAVYFLLPETKGIALERIGELLCPARNTGSIQRRSR